MLDLYNPAQLIKLLENHFVDVVREQKQKKVHSSNRYYPPKDKEEEE